MNFPDMDRDKKIDEFVEEQNVIEDTHSNHYEEMLNEMATVGYFVVKNKSGKPESFKFKVFVNDDEGNEPHLHVWHKKPKSKEVDFHTCICLSKVEYFHHDGKEDVFSPELKDAFVEFLKSKSINKRYSTNWEYALSMWNDNNRGKTQVDENSEVLDYTKLP